MRLPIFSQTAFPHRKKSSLKTRLFKSISSVSSVFLGTGLVLLAHTSDANALEEIKLAYGGFQFGSLAVQDLVAFANTGQPSPEIQSLLDVIQVDQATALSVLTTEVAIDNTLLEDVSQTFIAESFFQLVGTTIKMPNRSEQSWTYIKAALIDAAADNQVSAIEFIQEFDANSVTVDTDKIGPVVEQVQNDISTIEQFFEAGFL